MSFKMPSTERQFRQAVGRVLFTRNVWQVVVISAKGNCKSDKSLVEEFGGPNNVNVVHDLTALSKFNGLDVLIVNNVLGSTLEKHEELDAFIRDALTALKFGGALIIREDLSQLSNKKKVAQLTDYFDVFRTEIEGRNAGLGFDAVEEVEDSIHAKGNYLDFFWTLKKKEFEKSTGPNVTFRDFLDKTQYTDTGIYAYEWIFGDNFISPGGWDENLKIIRRFGNMKVGQKMLDIGVGIGGGARQAASEFGVQVFGIDLSSNMLAVALERIHKEKDSRVNYAICDAMTYQFEPNTFDYVFSRDCIQHIQDTEELFTRIYNALKPGGRVLITMYGVGHGELSEKFKAYVEQRMYFLKNLETIRELAQKVGFTDIETENMTPRFKEILFEERHRVESNKEEFLSKFSQKEYDSLVVGWSNKLKYIEDDNHNWNFFTAVKPL